MIFLLTLVVIVLALYVFDTRRELNKLKKEVDDFLDFTEPVDTLEIEKFHHCTFSRKLFLSPSLVG